MGRTSLLTDAQWHEITQRLLEFESCRALGREFGISEAAIRKRREQDRQVKIVVDLLNEAQAAYRALSPALQETVNNRLAELKRIVHVRPKDGSGLVATNR